MKSRAQTEAFYLVRRCHAALLYLLLAGTLGLGVSGSAPAAMGRAAVELACPAAPHTGAWTCLRVNPPRRYQGRMVRISVNDLRGGPVIKYRVRVEGRSVLVPLVFASGKNLPPGYWPLRIGFSGGNVVRWRTVRVALPVPRIRLQRVIAMRGDLPELSQLLAKKVLTRAAVMRISRRQLYSSPAVCFAGCRWLLIDANSAKNLKTSRVEAISAAGVNVLYVGSGPPACATRLHWQRWRPMGVESHITGTVWRLYGAISPRVISKRLKNLRLPPLAMPRNWFWLGILSGPAVCLLIGLSVLAAWPGKSARIFLVVLACAAAGLAVCGCFFLRESTRAEVADFHWTTRPAESVLELRRTLKIYRSLRRIRVDLPAAENIWPLADSAASWFSQEGTLEISGGQAHFQFTVKPRQAMILLAQTPVINEKSGVFSTAAEKSDLVKVIGESEQFKAWRQTAMVLRHGELWRVKGERRAGLGNWLAGMAPKMRQDVRAWLAVEFSPSRQYMLRVGRAGDFRVVEAGRP